MHSLQSHACVTSNVEGEEDEVVEYFRPLETGRELQGERILTWVGVPAFHLLAQNPPLKAHAGSFEQWQEGRQDSPLSHILLLRCGTETRGCVNCRDAGVRECLVVSPGNACPPCLHGTRTFCLRLPDQPCERWDRRQLKEYHRRRQWWQESDPAWRAQKQQEISALTREPEQDDQTTAIRRSGGSSLAMKAQGAMSKLGGFMKGTSLAPLASSLRHSNPEISQKETGAKTKLLRDSVFPALPPSRAPSPQHLHPFPAQSSGLTPLPQLHGGTPGVERAAGTSYSTFRQPLEQREMESTPVLLRPNLTSPAAQPLMEDVGSDYTAEGLKGLDPVPLNFSRDEAFIQARNQDLRQRRTRSEGVRNEDDLPDNARGQESSREVSRGRQLEELDRILQIEENHPNPIRPNASVPIEELGANIRDLRRAMDDLYAGPHPSIDSLNPSCVEAAPGSSSEYLRRPYVAQPARGLSDAGDQTLQNLRRELNTARQNHARLLSRGVHQAEAIPPSHMTPPPPYTQLYHSPGLHPRETLDPGTVGRNPGEPPVGLERDPSREETSGRGGDRRGGGRA